MFVRLLGYASESDSRGNGAEDGSAMRRTQQWKRNRAVAGSGGERARAPKSDLRVDFREKNKLLQAARYLLESVKRFVGSGGIEKSKSSEEKEGAGAALPRQCLQKTREGMRMVERDDRERAGAAYFERTR